MKEIINCENPTLECLEKLDKGEQGKWEKQE